MLVSGPGERASSPAPEWPAWALREAVQWGRVIEILRRGLLLGVKCQTVYNEVVIRSFRSKDTARLFRRESIRRHAGIERVAKRKLDHLHAAAALADLAAVPGNRFEALIGDRSGQYSIRINHRWRICFEWKDGDAWPVEIVDYH